MPLSVVKSANRPVEEQWDDLLAPIVQQFEALAPIALTTRILEGLGIENPEVYAGHIAAIILVFLIVIAAASFAILLTIPRLHLGKPPESTGRFATPRELRQTLLLPSYAKTVLAIACLFWIIQDILIAFFTPLSLTRTPIRILLIHMFSLSGIALLVRARVSAWQDLMPYVLGRPQHWTMRHRRLALFGGALHLWRRSKDSLEQRQEHILIVGPTGSGKTSRYNLPQIIHDAEGFASVFVIEVKAPGATHSVQSLAGPAWIKRGKPVTILDPWTDHRPIGGWNPLMELEPDPNNKDTRQAIDQVVDAIIRAATEQSGRPSADASYFMEEERRLLKVLCMIAIFKEQQHRSLVAVYEALSGPWDHMIRWTMTNRYHTKDLERYLKQEGMQILDSELPAYRKASLLSGALSKLKFLEDPSAKLFFSGHGCSLKEWLKAPGLLILRTPLYLPAAKSVASLITRMLILHLYEKPTSWNGKPLKAWLYLDELPSLAIPDFPQAVATLRDKGVGIVATVHDPEDLITLSPVRFGQQSAQSMLDNFRTVIVLPGCSPRACEQFSRALGQTDTETRSIIREGSDLIRMRYRRERKAAPLMTPDAIRHLPADQALIMRSKTRPFIVTSIPWWEDRHCQKLIDQSRDVQLKISMPKAPIPELPGAKPLDSTIPLVLSTPSKADQDLSLLPWEKKKSAVEEYAPINFDDEKFFRNDNIPDPKIVAKRIATNNTHEQEEEAFYDN